MAKENSSKINEQIKEKKKKILITATMIGVVIAIAGGFFVTKVLASSNTKKAIALEELNSLALKDYPVPSEEASKVYSRDIAKQTYILKNGAILFEGTMVFYNKECANLYTGITDKKELSKSEPDLSKEDIFGDKITKDALNRYFQNTTKDELSSADKLSKGIKKAINEGFKKQYGYEVVKNVLVTNHVVQ